LTQSIINQSILCIPSLVANHKESFYNLQFTIGCEFNSCIGAFFGGADESMCTKVDLRGRNRKLFQTEVVQMAGCDNAMSEMSSAHAFSDTSFDTTL
jgi:hypothetical protein